MKQNRLFNDDGGIDWDAPYQPHSDTSREAAESLQGSDAKRARVYRFIKNRGDRGATDEEIQIGLQMNPNTQRPRRVELEKSRLVVDSGRRRKTISGRSAVIWIAT